MNVRAIRSANEHDAVPGARGAGEALRGDPIYRLVGARLAHPVVLGMVIFAIVVVAIVFGPSTESRFIYTDF